jgi:hypothetical protein
MKFQVPQLANGGNRVTLNSGSRAAQQERQQQETSAEDASSVLSGKRKRDLDTPNAESPEMQRFKLPKTICADHGGNDSLVSKPVTKEGNYWRAVACEVVGADPAISDVLLYNQMLKMNRLLDSLPSSVASETEALPQVKASYGIVYRVYCFADKQSRIFQDEPQPVGYGSRPEHFAAQMDFSSLKLFEAKHKGMSFTIIHDFACCKRAQSSRLDNFGKEHEETASRSTKLKLFSPDLVRGLINICKSSPRLALYPRFELGTEIPNPHLWVFRDQHHITACLDDPEECVREQLDLFMKYFLDHKSEEFASVADNVSRGFISPLLLEYLFVSHFVLHRRL